METQTASEDKAQTAAASRIPDRVTATDAALTLIRTLKDIHGPVMFHQSGGCCDGSAPMCFALGDFKTGAQDVLLGEIEGSPFYIGKAQYEYWRHTQLIIDVVDGRGGMFSLEGPEGKRFLTRSRVFSDDEWAALKDSEQTDQTA
ncbi:DUF779 domain-containing protein [Thalassospira marina]|uniref:Acetaldehyde dehydrogenase n=1 Tax=Thalassospira marina TaxID=2048283 RepID=A0ABM6QFQ3_9PROT|nr:DUF779 domain-containing protein [Thalassospira marina]AUG55091.1 acetaldehyde dehydrogenase [Thalassospira marina]